MYKIMMTFLCSGCGNPVTGIGRSSVHIGDNANLQLVYEFCYLGDMEMLMQLWRPEFEFDGINSGSWYHCLPTRIVL